jgi:DNA invertase Pin-like site-specific DNA recombinase
MQIGYARVSTGEQNLELQVQALVKAGCERIYTDKVSGVKVQRPQLEEAIKYARKGDIIVVWRLDRFGRSHMDLVKRVIELNQRGIEFHSLTEKIDTTSPGGKFQFHVFSALAEFERDIIRERTLAGLRVARARGRLGGRPCKMTKEKVHLVAQLMKDRNTSIKYVCDLVGVSKMTIYRYVSPTGEIRLMPKD